MMFIKKETKQKPTNIPKTEIGTGVRSLATDDADSIDER
jgi:hypothetical protein